MPLEWYIVLPKGKTTHLGGNDNEGNQKIWGAYQEWDYQSRKLSGATLHYELNTPTTEYVTVAETLKEWIEVDAGAIVMLCGQYTDKKEPAKTEVSFVRKLNEVT